MIMYDELKKLPEENLIYTDTDSIIMRNNTLKSFNIGENLGQFKIEHENKEAIIYCKKTYSIGEIIKVAGITQRDITIEQFKEGKIESKRMKTIASTQEIEQVGTFEKVERNLKEDKKRHEETEEAIANTKVYIDHNITDITYFIPTIRKLCDTKI